jgi:hypothetical protein
VSLLRNTVCAVGGRERCAFETLRREPDVSALKHISRFGADDGTIRGLNTSVDLQLVSVNMSELAIIPSCEILPNPTSSMLVECPHRCPMRG